MKKFRRVSLVAAVALIVFTVALLAASCNYKDKYTLTFVSDGTEIASVTAKEGDTITPPADPVKDGYIFDGWYTAETGGEKAEIPTVMPGESRTYYARYAVARKVNYDFNLEGVTHTAIAPTVGKSGGEVKVADGADFEAAGFLFLGWTTEKDAVLVFTGGESEGQYFAGDSLALGSSDITLYAQWAQEFTDSDGSRDKVYVYVPMIGRGQGAAILMREGAERKLGFVSLDAESGVVEFEFYYEASEGGNVVGRINGESTFVYRDSACGSFLCYDYISGEYAEYILTADGYGKAVLSRMAGSQISTEKYGRYEYSEQYGDYTFFALDPATQEDIADDYFYFMVYREKVSGTEFDGTFRLQGYESASYMLYDNGELYNYRLDLNGYGDARLYSYDPIDEVTTLEAVGTYEGTENYEDYAGEWRFVSDSYSSFKFILNSIASSSGNISVYIEYDAQLNTTFTGTNGATLYLDGYGSAQYTVTATESYAGSCTVSESRKLITFVPYVPDGEGGLTAGGNMYFNVVWNERTFTVNTTGFVTDGTVIVGYEGEASIIEIPDGVTEIGDEAFSDLRTDVSLVSVTVPASVTAIGVKAFRNAYTLSRVTFLGTTPATVDWTAGVDPFAWPAGSFVIVVPEGSQDAYKEAWSDCTYTIMGSVEVTQLPEFEIKDNVLVRYNKQPDSPDMLDLVIPEGVTGIADYVFRGMKNVRSVDLGNVTHVGEGAFELCENLRKVIFTNVTHVGEGAFLGCIMLANGEEYGDGTIELPAIVAVGDNAFQGCESLKLVRLGENLASIGDLAFCECQTVAGEDPLFIELLGTEPPEMGLTVQAGNIAFRIKVQSIDVVKKCLESPAWNKYCRHLYVESGAEKGLYLDGENTLELDGRAVLLSTYTMFYEIKGVKITFYMYDDQTASYTTYTGDIGSDSIVVTIMGDSFSFVKAGDTATYVSADGKYTLVCNPRDLDPDKYKGETGYAEVTFNGVPTTLKISGYQSKTITEFTDSDGRVYNFEISLDGNTLVYTRKAAGHYKNITSADGSVINIRFAGSFIYVYGEIKYVVDGSATPVKYLPAWSDGSVFATETGENEYTFTRPYLNTTYTIVVTVSADMTTFTYTVQ